MVARLMLNTPRRQRNVVLTDDEKSGAKSLMNATEVKALFVVKVLLKTLPVKVIVWPAKLPSLDSTIHAGIHGFIADCSRLRRWGCTRMNWDH